MHLLRRFAVVISIGLVIAVAVAAMLRGTERDRARDLELTAAAQLGAERLSSLIESTEIVASLADEPSVAAAALAEMDDRLSVCGVSLATVSCIDGASMPSVDALETIRPSQGSDDVVQTRLALYDGMVTIVHADETGLGLVVEAPVTIVDAAPEAAPARVGDRPVERTEPVDPLPIALWVVDDTAGPPLVDDFTEDSGVRQTAVAVAGTDLFVVASGAGDVRLPAREIAFYVVLSVLGVALLALAGITLVMEQRALSRRASVDQLTRLANRSEFELRAGEALEEARRAATGLSLLLFDLNGFKAVNDTYGHHAGDEVLRIVGERLRKAVRDEDVVGRWGGDEFVVLMPGVRCCEQGGQRADQLAEAVGGRTRVDSVGESVRVKTSVGVAILPDHGSTLDELIDAADQAMYRAKRAGTTWEAAPVVDTESTGAAVVAEAVS